MKFKYYMRTNRILLLLIILLLSYTNAQTQNRKYIDVIAKSFREITDNDNYNLCDIFACDKNKDYALLLLKTDSVPYKIVKKLSFKTVNDSIKWENKRNEILIYITPNANYIYIKHPDCFESFSFPIALEPNKIYEMRLDYYTVKQCFIKRVVRSIFKPRRRNKASIFEPQRKSNNWSNNKSSKKYQKTNAEKSYYVSVYDKNGNLYTTGLYVLISGKSYIRIDNKQYELADSDKKEFLYKTKGNSEIEPFYIK